MDAIFEDGAGVVGWNTGGAELVQRRSIATFPSRLPERTVSAIVDDDSGRLWLRVSSGSFA